MHNKYKLILACLFISLSGLVKGQEITAPQQAIAIDSSYSNGHYLQRLDFFRKMPDQKKEIVFLGNSITEGGEWQELIPGKPVVNRGISGDVTYGVLARLDEVLSARPAKIFLLIGINDMKRGTPNATIVENIKRIVKITKAQSPGTKLYIQSILPINTKMLATAKSYSRLNNALVVDLNQQISAFCVANGIIFINLHPALADSSGELKKELSLDGLHLRASAYILWVEQLKKNKAL
jgi:lysophospholipase L1-like esterase